MKFVKLLFVTMGIMMSVAPAVHAAQTTKANLQAKCIPTPWGCVDPTDPSLRP